MADAWRVANLLGATGCASLILLVLRLYSHRFNAMRLGRRRMLSPTLIALMGGSYILALGFMCAFTAAQIDEDVQVEMQFVFTLSWLTALGWLVQLVRFQIMHTGPPPARQHSDLEAQVDAAIERLAG